MRKFYITFFMVMLTVSVFAQSPQKMSYQAVIRTASGQLVTTKVGIQISILQGNESGMPVYVETQTPTPNDNGLVSIEIGEGTPVSGTFTTIDWSDGPFFIKTGVAVTEPLTTYTISGVSQILSVPYALYAKTASNYSETDPVFLSHPANGISSTLIDNWNVAFGWGDHATAGYQPLISEGTVFQYLRGDKTWQTLDNVAVGLGSVENTALTTWPGSANITTLGTITTGVWNAGDVTSSGVLTGNTIVKSGGTASQFLKADGSVDGNTYLTAIREMADEFSASALQTNFTLTQSPSANCKLKMYINGVRISKFAYSNTGTSLTYYPTNNGSYKLTAGDRIQIDYYY